MPTYAITMLSARIGIPVLATMNPALGCYLGAPMLAGTILLEVDFLTAVVVAVITGPIAIVKLASEPRHLLLAGILVTFYVLSITAIAPKFGFGNTIYFVLVGQLLSAATLDHFGLFGEQPVALSWPRLSGLLLMATDVLLTQKT